MSTPAELIRAVYRPILGREILGSRVVSKDRDESYLGVNYYDWYFAAGRAFKPKQIGEIGVRYGYSLYSMAAGAANSMILLAGWDNESYGGDDDCLRIAYENLKPYSAMVYHVNTQDTDSIAHPAHFDLFHVDGDHSTEGAMHDLYLAWHATKPGGVILADDYFHTPSTRHGIDLFVERKGIKAEIIPTYGGMAVIQR